MKHLDQEYAQFIEQAVPLVREDTVGLLSFLISSCEGRGLYLVNQHQQILFCDTAFTTLTGLAASPSVRSACPDALKIDKNGKHAVRHILSDGHQLNLIKTAQQLVDGKGQIVGGIGLLAAAPEAVGDSVEQQPVNLAKQQNFHGIISRCPAMKDVFRIIQNAAQTEATVLVRGESGAGKELVAKAIHSLSARHDAPFLAVNCAALSSNLLESELFGHVRGAFTGAIKDHSGLFQRANGGTLFLDEVAEMPLDLQAKLLRVIQERNYVPVGGSKTMTADVRLVAATHRSLREEVRLGRFREDLMYRLRVVPIFLPPLRERREDIALLLWHFIQRHNDKKVRIIEKVDPDAMKVLLDYRWPGNIRELQNVVEYAFAVGRGGTLRISELPPEFRETKAPELPGKPVRISAMRSEEEEESAIRKALADAQGRIDVAADLLGMSRATFWRKRKRFNI